MKELFYIGNFKLSMEDAQSQLILGNAKVFRSLGYKVTLIGNDECLASDRLENSLEKYQEFDSYNIPPARRISDFVILGDPERQVLEFLDERRPEIVIAYGSLGFSRSYYRLGCFCKSHGITFVSNCADLPATSHGNILERTVKYCDWRIRYRIISNQSDGIIAASGYIRDFYAGRTSVPIVVVPPLRDTDLFLPPRHPEEESVRIIYAGEPFPIDGRSVDVASYKDRVDLAIDYCLSIEKNAKPFRIDIYGLTEEQYYRVVKRHANKRADIARIAQFHGRVSQGVIKDRLKTSDYTLLLRSKSRMTMAGFSSKLVDSICAGVPVITTRISDYEQCLEEGVHCFFIDLDESGKEALDTLISKDGDELYRIKQTCFASRIFDYKGYLKKVDTFVQRLGKAD